MRLDQENLQELNEMVMNMDKVVQVKEEGTSMDFELVKEYLPDVEVQTDLELVDKKYNPLFVNMGVINTNLEYIIFKN